MVFSFDSFPWLSPLKHTQTHTHIYRSNAAHTTTYKYDGRIENDRDGCHRGVRHDRVFSFPREWKGTAKVRRSGVFGNVRRRTQRMGEIGSRAIHRCVVVFLSLSLVGRTMRARVCVGFKARCRLAFERNTRERRERKVYEYQFRSSREKRSHHRLVFGRQKHVLFASSSVHFSHQKRRADDDFVHYSFVRPLFSVALACF